MMKVSIAVVAVAFLCMGCASRGPSEPVRVLDEQTALRIALVIEDVVSGVQDIESLPVEVEGFVVGTQEVRDVVETRCVRYKSVVHYKELECIGENERGLVERRNCEACQTRKHLDLVAIVVINENDDRRSMYEGIRNANRLPSSARAVLMDAFRVDHARRAVPGEWYETIDGQWQVK